MKSLLCHLVEKYFPLEQRPLTQQSLKVQKQEAKIFLVDRSGREKPRGNKFGIHGTTLKAANWPGRRPAQPLSIQRLGTTKLQGQGTIGHSYASGIKVRGGNCEGMLCALEICTSMCAPRLLLTQHTLSLTPEFALFCRVASVGWSILEEISYFT